MLNVEALKGKSNGSVEENRGTAMWDMRRLGPRVQKQNAEQIWKEFEDYLAPVMGMKAGERALYSYLLRHSRLEGRRGVVVGMEAMGRGAGQGYQTVRINLMRLVRKECVTVKPYRGKYAILVLTPEEVLRAIRPRDFASMSVQVLRVSSSRVLREAILRRERQRCFYCQQRLVKKAEIWFDHIVPLARGGSPDEENVVACCRACNRRKHTRSADELLRELYQIGQITKAQLAKRRVAVREFLRGRHRLAKVA